MRDAIDLDNSRRYAGIALQGSMLHKDPGAERKAFLNVALRRSARVRGALETIVAAMRRVPSRTVKQLLSDHFREVTDRNVESIALRLTRHMHGSADLRLPPRHRHSGDPTTTKVALLRAPRSATYLLEHKAPGDGVSPMPAPLSSAAGSSSDAVDLITPAAPSTHQHIQWREAGSCSRAVRNWHAWVAQERERRAKQLVSRALARAKHLLRTWRILQARLRPPFASQPLLPN